MKILDRVNRAFLLQSVLLACLSIHAVQANDDVVTERNSVLKNYGYSTSYLRRDLKPLTNPNLATANENSVLEESQRMTVSNRFDVARKVLYPSQYAPRNLNTLFEGNGSVFKQAFEMNFGIKGAKEWEGKCNQWSASSCDGTLSCLLAKVEKSGGLVCNGTILTFGELKELATGVYADEPIKGSFLNANSPIYASQTKEINSLDSKIERFLGPTIFPPHKFIDIAHDTIEKGQGFVVDGDPTGEIWNFPAHGIDSKNTVVGGRVIGSGDKISEEIKLIPPRFLIGRTQNAVEGLKVVDGINLVLLNLMGNKNKNSSTKISQFTKGQVSLLYPGASLPRDNNSFISSIKATNQLPSSVIAIVKSIESSTSSLESAVENLLQKREEILDSALKDGVKIDPNFQVKISKSVLHLLDEVEFKEHTPRKALDYDYTTVHISKKSMPSQVIFSRWGLEKREDTEVANRPDFFWIPRCQSEVCPKFAQQSKGKRFWDKQDYQNVGLTDLMDLIKSDKCLPLDEATGKVQSLASISDQIESNGVGSVSSATLKELKSGYNTLLNLNVPVKSSIKNKIERILNKI